MKTGKIVTNDFATVISAKKMQDTSLERGSTVYIMAERDVPAKRSDPYLKRTLVVTAKVVDGKVQIPNDNNEYRAYLVDPRNLEKVTGDDEKKLYEALGSRA